MGRIARELDRDPWGRSYKLVTKKMRPAALPITESLDPEFLDRVMDTLFPRREEHIPPRGPPPPWEEEFGIRKKEFSDAARKLGVSVKPPDLTAFLVELGPWPLARLMPA